MLYKRRGIKNFQWISIWQSRRDNLTKVIEKFNQYTIHELIETFERPQFDSRNQEENETLQTRR